MPGHHWGGVHIQEQLTAHWKYHTLAANNLTTKLLRYHLLFRCENFDLLKLIQAQLLQTDSEYFQSSDATRNEMLNE